MRVQYPKCAYGPYCKLNPIKNGVYISVEVSFYILSFLVITFILFQKLHWLRNPKCAYGPYCKLNPIKNGVYISVEVSFYILSFLVITFILFQILHWLRITDVGSYVFQLLGKCYYWLICQVHCPLWLIRSDFRAWLFVFKMDKKLYFLGFITHFGQL